MEEQFETKQNAITCVVVGDCKVGKTALLKRLTEDMFLTITYGQTIYDTYPLPKVKVDSRTDDLTILDIACTEDYEEWRGQHYKQAAVVIVCFSLVDPKTLQHVKSYWMPEIRKHRPSVPVIVIGTKLDLKKDEEGLNENDLQTVPFGKALQLTQSVGAVEYIECSAKTRENTNGIIEQIAHIAIRAPSSMFDACCVKI